MTASKWSQKHKTSCTRTEDAYTAAKPVSLRGSNAESSHLCNSCQQKRNKWVGVSCDCLLNFPPAPISAQSVTRIEGPGRRCTSAARRANLCTTAPASCRPPGTRTGRRRGRHSTPGDLALWTRAKTKAQIWAKGPTDQKKKKRRGLFITGIFPARDLFCVTV